MHFKVLPETITSEASWVRETLGPRHTAGLGGDLEMRVAMPIGLNKNKPNTNSKPQHSPHPRVSCNILDINMVLNITLY